MIFAVTCPYCGKKMRVDLSQLLFRGRLSVGCPKCGRQVFAAVKAPLMVMYLLEGTIAVLLFVGAAKLDLGLGKWGNIGIMTLLLVTLVALFEGLFRVLFRDEVLYAKTVELMKLERQMKASQAAAAKEAEQKAKRHPQKR